MGGRSTKSRKTNEGVAAVHEPPDGALGGGISTGNGSLEREKLSAEVQKLREEIRVLAANRRWPWLLRTAVPALIVSLGSALGGYLFGDSLQARTNSQIRTEVLKTYFSVENQKVGKRKQILGFVISNLARNDPELLAWVKRESLVVDEAMARLDREISELKEQIERTKAEKPVESDLETLKRLERQQDMLNDYLRHALVAPTSVERNSPRSNHLREMHRDLLERIDEKDPYSP